MTKDEGIQAVRDVREAISAEFGNDPKKLIAHYIELQKRHARRLIESSVAEPDDAANRPAADD